jgi:hypothetical protein
MQLRLAEKGKRQSERVEIIEDEDAVEANSAAKLGPRKGPG